MGKLEFKQTILCNLTFSFTFADTILASWLFKNSCETQDWVSDT